MPDKGVPVFYFYLKNLYLLNYQTDRCVSRIKIKSNT